MSIEYDIYLKKHIQNVIHSANWLLSNIPVDRINDILPDLNTNDLGPQLMVHDQSKFGLEYTPYDKYFYGDSTDPEVKKDFDFAWLHHLRNNPHHWQHWVLIDDDGEFDAGQYKIKALDIPDNYILEMIADWWSFSWNKHYEILNENQLSQEDSSRTVGLDEIFKWYSDHRVQMVLSDLTRTKVEMLLDEIKTKLAEIDLQS